ncbi:Phage tail assembly chaperone protein [Pseudomonas sp. NFACC32-1]|uniref:tail fiber assembly protein n=1 Tax=unclassified Pseudomonas TaxID=196821 RepID=UPI000876B564|nr:MULTISPECIES: tail fiber assembly protein [unclassified Pseudomonas]MDB6446132.1 tail fiber assembly protein [Pseudomonas sp. 21TX0197]SCX70955.1 Phage tail assembly chaperone protein [Pseudomonas sp. NFACC32-1]SFW98024.1 Phage tail assembly chaperone protein [Pseudomonas sp. NFACC36]SFY22230.1 Phage tail assembly chaperone protein [Pseudomonas sp. NFACC49-2]
MSEISNAGPLEIPLAVPTLEIELAAIRSRRNQLLRDTDFTQLPDFPATDTQRAEVKAYRQALRDIPEEVDDPSRLVWPVMPAFIK